MTPNLSHPGRSIWASNPSICTPHEPRAPHAFDLPRLSAKRAPRPTCPTPGGRNGPSISHACQPKEPLAQPVPPRAVEMSLRSLTPVSQTSPSPNLSHPGRSKWAFDLPRLSAKGAPRATCPTPGGRNEPSIPYACQPNEPLAQPVPPRAVEMGLRSPTPVSLTCSPVHPRQ